MSPVTINYWKNINIQTTKSTNLIWENRAIRLAYKWMAITYQCKIGHSAMIIRLSSVEEKTEAYL